MIDRLLDRVPGWRASLLLALSLMILAGCDDFDAAPELSWDDLLPEDWHPEHILDRFDAEDLDDEDPRAEAMLAQLRELWEQAPVVAALDGREVRLPGFVVPLELDGAAVREFLLVPYFGACIHVPPPPPNQIVHVITAEGQAWPGGLFDTVWVRGQMRVVRFGNALGDAGYRIEDARVRRYVFD